MPEAPSTPVTGWWPAWAAWPQLTTGSCKMLCSAMFRKREPTRLAEHKALPLPVLSINPLKVLFLVPNTLGKGKAA